MVKLSVITVTYNSEDTVAETFESVLSQTLQPYEYIVVDGNSADGTVEVIKKYESKFRGCMRWISEPDKGIYDAMNKGISMASGDVISILNSDDLYFDQYVLEEISNTFKETDADLVFSDVYYFSNKCGSEKFIRKWFGRPGCISLGWIPPHPGVFVKKHVYQSKGLFDTSYSIAADYDFLLRVFLDQSIKKIYHSKCTVRMRLGGESTRGIVNIIKGNREVYGALIKNKVKFPLFTLLCRHLRRPIQFLSAVFSP